ncbi:MAG: uracil-DNA glycosylase family protein [Planctomycetes bacterium]|nr:uracil-DNA glycosylase family protein [Planctomycetota bacterium]MCB9872306.1 uracil-DNA glycosylase family protein [Planctomycetota bacterium]
MTELLAEVRNCRACTDLPLGPRPVLRASATARVLIVGQAPGTRVHASGVPWDDPSGDRLRCWLALDRAAFYDQQRIAIIPMGLCYPGRGPSGDLPPRRACAELWFARLLEALPCIEVTVLAGQYAQAHYLGSARRRSLTETVRAFRDYAPRFFPTPHPSPRNTLWLRRNPWFEADVVPVVRAAVHRAIGTDPHPGRGHAATRDSTAGGDPTRS